MCCIGQAKLPLMSLIAYIKRSYKSIKSQETIQGTYNWLIKMGKMFTLTNALISAGNSKKLVLA